MAELNENKPVANAEPATGSGKTSKAVSWKCHTRCYINGKLYRVGTVVTANEPPAKEWFNKL